MPQLDLIRYLLFPLLLLRVLFLPALLPSSSTMDRIRGVGIDLNAPTREYLPVLVSQPLENLRVELFRSASLSGLATDGDALVSRRDTRKSPLRHKLADDITTLLHCLKNNSKVPRSLLKNGKRSADYLESSRQSELTSSQAFSTTASSPPPTPPPPAILPNDSVRLSVIMKDINLLRDDINDLKREVAHLNCHIQPSPLHRHLPHQGLLPQPLHSCSRSNCSEQSTRLPLPTGDTHQSKVHQNSQILPLQRLAVF